jgi:hypothetical protein
MSDKTEDNRLNLTFVLNKPLKKEIQMIERKVENTFSESADV